MSPIGSRSDDPLSVLREYRHLAPWSLRDMATLAGAILESSGIRPLNAAATARPSERTIRFYVARGLVTPPSGRGTAATYTYRHILHVLHIKLRQMEGFTLETIAQELTDMTGDVLERRVASALGPGFPAPENLPLTSNDRPTWGRAGRALRSWLSENTPEDLDAEGAPAKATTWRRLPVSRGVELHVQGSHPLAQLGDRDTDLADAVRLAVTRVLGMVQDPPDSHQARADTNDSTEPRRPSN
jgi:DNA-binding transcriptional MerR regulator